MIFQFLEVHTWKNYYRLSDSIIFEKSVNLDVEISSNNGIKWINFKVRLPREGVRSTAQSSKKNVALVKLKFAILKAALPGARVAEQWAGAGRPEPVADKRQRPKFSKAKKKCQQCAFASVKSRHKKSLASPITKSSARATPPRDGRNRRAAAPRTPYPHLGASPARRVPNLHMTNPLWECLRHAAAALARWPPRLLATDTFCWEKNECLFSIITRTVLFNSSSGLCARLGRLLDQIFLEDFNKRF